MVSEAQVEARVSARYRALMDEVAEEEGGWESHGSKQRVSSRLGISASVLTKLRADPSRSVMQSLAATMAAMRLDPSYFFAQRLTRGDSYRAYLASAPADPPQWREFLAEYARPRSLSSGELEAIRDMAAAGAAGIHHWTDIVALAEWVMRRGVSPHDT